MSAEAPARAPQAPRDSRAEGSGVDRRCSPPALFLPMIAFTTVQSMQNDADARDALGIVLLLGRDRRARCAFCISLFIAPWLERRPSKATAASAPAPRWRKALSKWFAPFALGFAAVYPFVMVALTGWSGALKWIDNFGIQILIYVMLGWGLNIVVGLAGLLDLGYVAFYAVGAYSYALAGQDLRPLLLDAAAAGRNPRGLLGHPARLSGAAAARRLPRARHAGVRRNHPAGADQLGASDRRLCRYQRHSAPDLLRDSVQRVGGRLRRGIRTGIYPALPHDLSVLRHSRLGTVHRFHHGAAAPDARRAGLGSVTRR